MLPVLPPCTMATFFRDSSLFASRNGKPLFGERKEAGVDVDVEAEKEVDGEVAVEVGTKMEHRDEPPRDEPTDDDEVEITDVRELADTAENTMDNSVNNETGDTLVDGGDKSLEYLLSTIAHLNDRNSKLHGQLTLLEKQNKHLATELAVKTDSVETLKTHLARVRSTVKSSHALFAELRAQFAANAGSTSQVAAELANTKKSVAKQHEVIASLKNLVAKIKTELTSNEIAMHEKNSAIANLKRQNNDLAGQLTEQKLENTALQRNSTERARSYEHAIAESSNRYTELLNRYSVDSQKQVEGGDRVVALVSGKLEESSKWAESAVGVLRENLNDNFNDIALRLTALAATADTVSVNVAGEQDRLDCVQREIVSALSDVDKNLTAKLGDAADTMVKKVNGLPGVSEVQSGVQAVLTAVDKLAENVSQIDALKEERRQLEKVVVTVEGKVDELTREVKTKAKMVDELQNKLQIVILEKGAMEREKDSAIHALEDSTSNLARSLKELQLQVTTDKERHKQEVHLLQENARKVETQNIKLFNDERNKNTSLERDLKQLQTELDNERHKLQQQSQLFTDCTTKIEQLEDQLSTYKSDNSSEKIAKLSEKIDILRDNVTEKQKIVDSLRATLHEKDKTIANLTQPQPPQVQTQTQTPLPPLPPPPPPPIFPESRTSTVIKKEPLSQVKTEKKPTKKPKTKRVKPVSKATTARGNKRKLLDSSQESTKSQTSLKKRTDSVKKSILEDLDIFNEFVAMDRMESIGKPSW